MLSIGKRGSAVGWGSALQAGRSRFRLPMVFFNIFHRLNPSGRTMPLGSSHPLTEMSTLGGKGGRCVGLTTLPPSCASTSWTLNGLSMNSFTTFQEKRTERFADNHDLVPGLRMRGALTLIALFMYSVLYGGYRHRLRLNRDTVRWCCLWRNFTLIQRLTQARSAAWPNTCLVRIQSAFMAVKLYEHKLCRRLHRLWHR